MIHPILATYHRFSRDYHWKRKRTRGFTWRPSIFYCFHCTWGIRWFSLRPPLLLFPSPSSLPHFVRNHSRYPANSTNVLPSPTVKRTIMNESLPPPDILKSLRMTNTHALLSSFSPDTLGIPKVMDFPRLHYWRPVSPISWTLSNDAKPPIHQIQSGSIEGKVARADNFCLHSLLSSSYLSHSPRSRTNFLVCYEASTYLAHSILYPFPLCNSAPFRLQIWFFLLSIFFEGLRI